MSSKTREFDHLFKVVLIGDASVGKTSLLLRFADDSFEDNYISTVGVDFRFRTVTVDNELVKMQIWDTAGQERFRTITSAYYRGANAVILIYDITNYETFSHVQDWLDEVHKAAGESVTNMFVGNKSDLINQRQVSEDEAKQRTQYWNGLFLETSAKTAVNVDKAFYMIAKSLVKKSGNNINGPTGIELTPDNKSYCGCLCACIKVVLFLICFPIKFFIRRNNEETAVPMKQLEFPEAVIMQDHLGMFSVEKSISELSELKGRKRLNFCKFVVSFLMLLLFPFTIAYQTIIFWMANYTENQLASLLPSDFKVSNVKKRITADLLGIILFSQQTSFNLGGKNKSFSTTREFATKTAKQLCLRSFLVILCFAVYVSIWFPFIWYQNQTDINISSAESVGPVVIFTILVITVALWLSVETEINMHSVDLESVHFHPLHFSAKYDEVHIAMKSSSNCTNIQKFVEIVREQPMNNKCNKLISVLKLLFAVVYGFLSALTRIVKNKSFTSDHMSIFVMGTFSNIFLMYIVVILCEITTTASFRDVLAYFQAVTQILNPYKKQFIASSYYLPYLNVKYEMNLPSWIQLRGFVHIQSVSRMNNVELWMGMFILAQITLCGAALYRLVAVNEFDFSGILGDSVFLSCVMSIVLGCVYIFVVVWIGSLFHNLHQKQIRALSAQASRIDYEVIKNEYVSLRNEDDEESDDEKDEMIESMRAQKCQHAIERTIMYLTQNDITPTVCGVRLDKVLRKSLIGVFGSVITSGIAAYLRFGARS
eukprot:321760_1